MLGVCTPLPLRNEPQSIIQQNDCLRVDEILAALNNQLGLNFNRDDLLDLAVRIGRLSLLNDYSKSHKFVTGDGCAHAATGQFRTQQVHWIYHKVIFTHWFGPCAWHDT